MKEPPGVYNESLPGGAIGAAEGYDLVGDVVFVSRALKQRSLVDYLLTPAEPHCPLAPGEAQ